MNGLIKKLSTQRWIGALLIVIFGMIAYHNCLPNEMFWDDDDFINNNRFIRDFHDWPLWFTQNLVAGSYLVSNYWRPLLLFIFAIEWHCWPHWVYGWHMVSIGAHILAGLVLYALIFRLFKDNLLALITALLFVVHPVHNEAVVYVNSMGDSLAAFMVISSLYLYAGFRHSQKPAFFSRRYFASLLLFPLAILSKETGFVLAGLLPLMDFILLSKANTFWKRAGQVAAAWWPYSILALVYIYLRGHQLNFSNSFNFYNENNAFTGHIITRLMTFFKVMVQYTGFLFCPYQLRVERFFDYAHSVFEWDVIAGGILVGSMLFCAFKYWRQKPWVSFGIGWFFIAIAPASNVLVPINSLIYEHFLYMPMIGIAFVAAYLGLEWARKHNGMGTLLKLLAVVLVIFCGINIHRNLDWRTSIGFYEQLITYRPDDYRVINNLGMEYANKGFTDKAIAEYQKAIALDPSNPVAYHNIGGAYRDTGHVRLALDNFNKAIGLNPDFIFTYRSLADLYWRLGQWEKCKESILQILRIDPNDANIHQALQQVEEKLK